MTARVDGRAMEADPRLVWRWVRAEALTFPRSLWLWLGFLGVFLAIGAVAALRSLIPGDKGVATTPSFEWGILIVGYVFFAITTSGLCLASSLGTVFGIERFRPLEKRHAILAVLSLVTAFGIIALDLQYPLRIMFGVVFNPSPASPMWWMGVCYGFYLCVLLTEVWSMFTDHPTIHQVACTAAMCTAIVAPTTLGAVFGVVASRAFWAGPFTPILMVSTAFLSGTALLGIVFYVVHRLQLDGWERAATVAIPSIRLLLTVAILLVAGLVTREVVVGLTATDRGLLDATRALVLGPLAVQFWGLRVVAGLVVPFLLIVVPATRTPAGTFAASCLIWVGVFADRLTFVSAGEISPVTAVAGVVSKPYAAYTPSPVEIGIILGAFAFIAFVYTLAERYLDLHEAAAHPALSLSSLMPARFRGPDAVTAHGVAAHVPQGMGAPAAPDASPAPSLAPATAPATPLAEPEPDGVEIATSVPVADETAPADDALASDRTVVPHEMPASKSSQAEEVAVLVEATKIEPSGTQVDADGDVPPVPATDRAEDAPVEAVAVAPEPVDEDAGPPPEETAR